jgi:hypothetical protein
VTGRLLLLACGCLALWVLLAIPARHLGGGEDAVLYSGAAALLSGVPMLVSAAVTMRVARREPRLVAIAVLGVTGARMFAVLGCGLLLAEAAPFFRATAFWLWLAAFYPVTLAAEVATVLTSRLPDGRAGGDGSTLP